MQHLGRDLDALFAHPLDLGLERPGIEHDAVADHRGRAADDPARQQRQLVGLVADDQRVAGVVAALEAHDHVGPAGQPVDDLALAFVAPLGADDGDVTHVFPHFGGRGAPRGPRRRASSAACGSLVERNRNRASSAYCSSACAASAGVERSGQSGEMHHEDTRPFSRWRSGRRARRLQQEPDRPQAADNYRGQCRQCRRHHGCAQRRRCRRQS